MPPLEPPCPGLVEILLELEVKPTLADLSPNPASLRILPKIPPPPGGLGAFGRK